MNPNYFIAIPRRKFHPLSHKRWKERNNELFKVSDTSGIVSRISFHARHLITFYSPWVNGEGG